MQLTEDEKQLLSPFMWDVDIGTVDREKHKRFIIERVLRYGRPGDVLWLMSRYSDEDIIETVKKSRRMDRRTAGYWAVHYGISREEITCLNMSLTDSSFY